MRWRGAAESRDTARIRMQISRQQTEAVIP